MEAPIARQGFAGCLSFCRINDREPRVRTVRSRWENAAMRVAARRCACCAWLACLAAGCAQNPYMMQRQIAALQQQQTTLAQQNAELQTRAAALDKDNQELEMLLAQERQGRRVADDQVLALREQLSGAATQIARLKESSADTQKKAEALVASTRRRAGASISANNSLLEELPAINVPGAQIRRDGELIRIELPADQLFDEAVAELKPAAGAMLDAVAAELRRTYPEQLIGIEGHTDNTVLQTDRWKNPHELSTARANAVFHYLAARTKLRDTQMSVAGHGSNRPVVSNATQAGRERNRRIEVVIYPDRPPAR
jgi:flagellar motor protein MotB